MGLTLIGWVGAQENHGGTVVPMSVQEDKPNIRKRALTIFLLLLVALLIALVVGLVVNQVINRGEPTITPSGAAQTATASCADFLEQFPGTPCPPAPGLEP